uniref:Uncharacterized protein n=1 Tax=Meloidogyne enterolobii TaxID=390850 RepID=A0A6V7UA39_MELEN|nr:unnamed protein product [Meloidogyne enterolobii]
MTEHKREKREFLALSGILILVCWSFTLGPFTQMQITSRVNMIGSFQEGGCIYRFITNGFKNYCAPTEKEINDKHLIQQIFMILFKHITKTAANLLRYLYSHTFGLINRSEFKIEENLTLREDFFLFLFRHQLVPIGYVPEVLLTEKDEKAWKIYQDFVQGTKTDESMHCDEISKEWENKLKNKKLKEFDHDKLENILRCKCNNLFSNWGDLGLSYFN